MIWLLLVAVVCVLCGYVLGDRRGRVTGFETARAAFQPEVMHLSEQVARLRKVAQMSVRVATEAQKPK